jgi:hypothetical protein
MRYLRLLNPDQGPREGIPYTDPATGWTSRCKTLKALFENAKQHRIANAIAIPADFELQIETQWCMANPDCAWGATGCHQTQAASIAGTSCATKAVIVAEA